jgi:HEAT repeat protein
MPRDRHHRAAVILAIAAVTALSAPAAPPLRAAGPDDERLLEALLFPNADVAAIRARGPKVLPALARVYERSGEDRRAVIARVFYELSWQSPEAKRVLMRDVHTRHPQLRLQAQWALGRVSNDDDVVDVLLGNMQNDDNPLFRDKAACALAYDQVFLTAAQKARLYERLIRALRDPKPQVRAIAIQALQIHTGQTKEFEPDAPAARREERIRVWENWLRQYRASL